MPYATPATSKQLDFIRALATQTDGAWQEVLEPEYRQAVLDVVEEYSDIDKKLASKVIDALKALRGSPSERARQRSIKNRRIDWDLKVYTGHYSPPLAREGYRCVSNEEFDRVTGQTGQTGTPEAPEAPETPEIPEQAPEAPESVIPGFYRESEEIYRVVENRERTRCYAKRLVDGKWEYAPGVMKRLTPEMRMGVDEVAEYGRATGNCMVCSRTLTNPESIQAGIGPVCATRV